MLPFILVTDTINGVPTDATDTIYGVPTDATDTINGVPTDAINCVPTIYYFNSSIFFTALFSFV